MLKLEVGKSYKNREGYTVKITEICHGRAYPYLGNNLYSYLSTGQYNDVGQTVHDLICEHIDERDARIAELERQIKGERDQADLIAKDRDFTIQTLKVRVEELEEEVANNQKYVHVNLFEKLKHERDSLRTQLAEANETARQYKLQRDNILEEMTKQEKEFAALKPAEPTIVKTTWQNVYAQRRTAQIFDDKAYADIAGDGHSLGYIRRDHMSDGKIVATLEPVGGKQ